MDGLSVIFKLKGISKVKNRTIAEYYFEKKMGREIVKYTRSGTILLEDILKYLYFFFRVLFVDW